jgi:hypothetical protein
MFEKTDKQRLVDLLTEFGLIPELDETGQSATDDELVTLQEGQPLVDGYSGFYCTFVFDRTEKFTGVRIYE